MCSVTHDFKQLQEVCGAQHKNYWVKMCMFEMLTFT